MDFLKHYHQVVGLLILAFVTIVMIGTPSTFVGSSVSFIYANLSNPTSNQVFVRTTMDFGDNQRMQSFPKEIGEWTGTDYDVASVQELLGADVMLMRAYTKPGLYQPLFFLAMQSKSRSSFHPPEICYPALGYEIQEEGDDQVEVTDAVWLEKPLFPELAPKSMSIDTWLPLKKLVVTKGTNGEITERRTVVYFYVKLAPTGTESDAVTMIRVSAIAPTEGSYESILNAEKTLLADFIPHMFEFHEAETIIILQLAKSGIMGILLILVSFFVPLALVFYPQLAKVRRHTI